MLKYKVFFSAVNKDGRREMLDLKVIAANPKDAMDEAFRHSQPRFAGQDGWEFGMAVDELTATDADEESTS